MNYAPLLQAIESNFATQFAARPNGTVPIQWPNVHLDRGELPWIRIDVQPVETVTYHPCETVDGFISTNVFVSRGQGVLGAAQITDDVIKAWKAMRQISTTDNVLVDFYNSLTRFVGEDEDGTSYVANVTTSFKARGSS